MTIFKYALLRGLRNPISLLCNCVLPVGFVFLRPVWTEGNTNGFSFVALVIMSGAFLMARNMLIDKTDGSIIRILAAPITMLHYLVQNLLACMVPLVIQIVLVCFTGAILYQWTFSFVAALTLCYTMFMIASVSMSFAWNCLFKNRENSYSAFGLVLTFITFLSGLFISLERFPYPLRYVGAIFPAYWASNGINLLLSENIAAEYWFSLLAMLLFAAVYLLYGGKRRIV